MFVYNVGLVYVVLDLRVEFSVCMFECVCVYVLFVVVNPFVCGLF